MNGTQIEKQTNKKSKKTRNIILSIVAAAELILLLISLTFSWFEGLTSLEMKGTNIKTAAGLNSHVILGENKTEEDTDFSEIIDLTTFFDTQKEVRLSPVSSTDGITFYASYDGTPDKDNYTSLKYRKLAAADINTGIINFDFNISSPDGPADVYLTEIFPTVTINGIEYDSTSRYTNPYRFAFSDGTTTHVLRVEDELNSNVEYVTPKQEAISSLNEDDTPIITDGTVERAQEYAYYADHRAKVDALGTTAEGTPDGANIKPLFHLEKNEVKTITVSVWLEALDYECLNDTQYKPVQGDNISFAVKLCTSWSIPTGITVYDRTPAQWINTTDTVTKDNDMVLYVRNADGGNTKRLYKLTYNEVTHAWTGNIPLALSNCEFVWISESDSTKKAHVTWKAPYRQTADGQSEITMFGSSTCIWGIGADDVTEIFFKDYTSKDWIYDNTANIRISIVYNSTTYDYKMSDAPSPDHNGKDTWSCWIPSSVQLVIFNRCKPDSTNEIWNTWIGSDRGTETVYIAADSGSTGNDTRYTLYLKLNITNPIFLDNYAPAISFTGQDNYDLIEEARAGNKISQLDIKSANGYNPSEDEWRYGDSRFTMVNEGDRTLWKIDFESKPSSNTKITIWNRTAHGFTNIADNQSFGSLYFPSQNTLIFNGTRTEIKSDGANNNYYLYFDQGNTGSGNGTTSDTLGKWGDMNQIEEGSYTTYFVHQTDVTSVSVNFYVGNYGYTYALEKGEGNTWYTNRIPDNVTHLTFTDSNGNTWDSSGSSIARSETTPYYYVREIKGSGTNSTGIFSSKIVLSGHKINFKHYDTSATKLTASFEYIVTGVSGVPFTVELTKGSDNLTWSTSSIPDSVKSITFSDGTNTWTKTTGTGSRNTTSESYVFAINKDTVEWKDSANFVRIYFTNNYNWNNRYIYYWGGTSSTTWPGSQMIKVAVNGDNQNVYAYLVPSSSTGIIFDNGNNGGSQTVDIKSNITDMMGFYISGNSSPYGYGTWNVSASFLNTH